MIDISNALRNTIESGPIATKRWLEGDGLRLVETVE